MILLSVFVAVVFQQPTPLPAPTATLPPLPQGVADTSPFRRLALPTPNELRTASGAPGPKYWQQRVDYSIRATLDTGTHSISGTETIRYANHSPDTLRYLWFQVDQNIYAHGSRGSYINPADARWSARGFVGGYAISDLVVVRGAGSGRRALHRIPLERTMNGTLMRVDLDRPLSPGQTVRIDLTYRFQVPAHGSDRMGREHFPGGWLYEIAEWYPRLVVYDDVHGWNTDPYLGQGEFYLEYGDIDFALTVPRNYIVAGTGTLVNPLEVLTAAQRARLAQARTSDSAVAIVTRQEAGTPGTRPSGTAPVLTWRFTAKNVRDVAWAAAPDFMWDASGWDGILMQAYYPPEANPDWSNAIVYVRHSIRHYSEKWFHYPYPTAINVAGPVGGMEYPMIVFCSAHAGARRQALFGVTTHELGHQWFPMVVGSNERRYAWMDEGFNTFLNIYSTLTFFHGSVTPRRGGAERWAQYAARGRDVPMMLPADRVPPPLLGQAEYNKPATGLYLLRHHILADTTRFDAAFREYIRRWAFKHPTPADFFRTMEDGLGRDLSWFWRGWFYRTDVVDQAVDSVTTTTDSTGARTTHVFLSSPGALPMPVDLTLTFADGSTETARLPVEIWYLGNHFEYDRQLRSALVRVEIDRGEAFPDVRRTNNVWSAGQ